jgi:hypothetical protein
MLHSIFSFKGVDIEFNVMGDGMARGQILVFDHHTTGRTVKLYEPTILRVRAKTVSLTFHQWRMHFLQRALRHQTPFLVVLPCTDQRFPTPLTYPLLPFQIDL